MPPGLKGGGKGKEAANLGNKGPGSVSHSATSSEVAVQINSRRIPVTMDAADTTF